MNMKALIIASMISLIVADRPLVVFVSNTVFLVNQSLGIPSPILDQKRRRV